MTRAAGEDERETPLSPCSRPPIRPEPPLVGERWQWPPPRLYPDHMTGAPISRDTPCPPAARGGTLRRRLGAMLWQQSLWAVLFALFFGTVIHPSLAGYRFAFAISLIFAYVIRLCLIALQTWGLPWLERRYGRALPIVVDAPAYI